MATGRVTIDAEVMQATPASRGRRIGVGLLPRALSAGATLADLSDAHSHLSTVSSSDALAPADAASGAGPAR